ncbi:MAG: hypothetical protein IID39_03580 [Planctomycetes bacterium]|nr:hypothetical protein [Planctomycetota bacterium]
MAFRTFQGIVATLGDIPHDGAAMGDFSSRQRTAALATALAVLTWVPITAVNTAAGFALLAYLPGRVLLRRLGVESHWSAAGRTVLALGVSLAVVPFMLNPLWHFCHEEWVIRLIVWAATLVLIFLTPNVDSRTASDRPRKFFEFRPTRIAAGIVAVIIVLAVVLPYWPTELFGYPVPATIHDFVKHHAVLDSLQRRSLPLGNVFYADGANEPVSYYHFFYLIPATVRLWTGHNLSIELAFGISSALVALSTTGMIYLITKRFYGGEAPATLAAALVTVVGALDIFPFISLMIEQGRPLLTLDAWAVHPYRIHNFLNQMTWSPQNVSAILIVLLGSYVLSTGKVRRGWLVLGPILGASLLGSSVWVALGALPALAVWAMTRPRILLGAVAVATLMIVASAPTLIEYSSLGAQAGRGLTTEWPANPHGALGRLVEPGVFANLLNLPTQLVLEFGAKVLLLVLVPVTLWRRMWRDDGLRYLCIAGVVSIVAFVIVRSELRHNAFGQKIVMLAMAFTAIMAAAAVAADPGPFRWWNPLGWRAMSRASLPGANRILMAILVLGLPMGLYEAPLTAARRYLEQALAFRRASPERAAALSAERAALTFMRYKLPADAVVQGEGSPQRAELAQLVRKQIGVMEPQDDVMVFDPPDRESYLQCVDEVLGALRIGESAARTHEVLRKHRITHVFIGLVEREAWARLERFEAPQFFSDVFRQGETRVVSVLSPE